MWEKFGGELVKLFPQLLVTFLGVFLAFSLDRAINRYNRKRDSRRLLYDLRDELEEIKRRLFPETKAVFALYPDIWDSAISSGQIRLLNSDQVRELTKVYAFVKGTHYEAEWVRRAIEEFNNIPVSEKERRKWLQNRYQALWMRQLERGEKLSKQIETILQEKWWALKTTHA